MKQFFITGTSSGIGRALTDQALAGGNLVDGLSRTRLIEDKNYNHHTMDLADPEKVRRFKFKVNASAETLILINNAASLGEVKPLGEASADRIIRTFNVNVASPSILCAHFLAQTKDFKGSRIIINISSGAAKFAIPSWSTYCASKAAINQLTEVLQVDYPDVQCLSISPGVVDTAMQKEIRELSAEDFPDKQRFIDYKKNDGLSKPDDVAKRILDFASHPEEKPSVSFSLRDV